MIFKCFICKEPVSDMAPDTSEEDDTTFKNIKPNVVLYNGPHEISICHDCFKENAPQMLVSALHIGEKVVAPVGVTSIEDLKKFPYITCEEIKEIACVCCGELFAHDGVLTMSITSMIEDLQLTGYNKVVCHKCLAHDTKVIVRYKK